MVSYEAHTTGDVNDKKRKDCVICILSLSYASNSSIPFLCLSNLFLIEKRISNFISTWMGHGDISLF